MVNGEALGVNRVSQAAIGRALDLSQANITKLKKKGMPVDSVESAQAWREARQNVAARKAAPKKYSANTSNPHVAPGELPSPPKASAEAGRVTGGGISFDPEFSEDYKAARTRREIAEANLAEMQESEERGLTIRVDAVKIAFATAFSTAREALLQIPSRLAPLLAAESDPAGVQNMLHAEIHQALAHLAGTSDRLAKPAESTA